MRTQLSPAEQQYVKTIYLLQQEVEPVTTRRLAQRLGVTPASVSGMVKQLAQAAEGPYVVHTRYAHIEVTAQGRAVAVELVRHQRLLELFFVEVLEMPWDQVHAEAERLAPLISEELEERIAAKLGQPTRDPHGEPIPTREGLVEQGEEIPLDSLEVGSRACIVRVPDEEPALLRYFSTLGIVPGAWITLESRIPYGDVLTVRLGEASHPLAGQIAHRIAVRVSRDRQE
jgi:DtxR family Mn-dependent transcriptional regulator